LSGGLRAYRDTHLPSEYGRRPRAPIPAVGWPTTTLVARHCFGYKHPCTTARSATGVRGVSSASPAGWGWCGHRDRPAGAQAQRDRPLESGKNRPTSPARRPRCSLTTRTSRYGAPNAWRSACAHAAATDSPPRVVDSRSAATGIVPCIFEDDMPGAAKGSQNPGGELWQSLEFCGNYWLLPIRRGEGGQAHFCSEDSPKMSQSPTGLRYAAAR
jgi:hypothetical protein